MTEKLEPPAQPKWKWSLAEMDNDKVQPTIRIFKWFPVVIDGEHLSDKICVGRIDSKKDARELVDAANAVEAIRVGPTMLTSCCETHSEDDKRKFNTCPICLLAVHKRTCEERDKLKRLLESFPGLYVGPELGDPWIEQLRSVFKL